ncbi:hypothetical protein FRB96_004964 [Tulasnella sp. 330]|nr:hypothetical protein FRB96_004964 [Tulasnella sp. 330]
MSKPAEKEHPPFNYEESFRVTHSPHPNFQPGTGGAGSKFLDDWRKKGEEFGYTTIDPEKTEPNTDPPLLIISCTKPGPGKDKDTAVNIRVNKTFTVNIISEPFADNANWTSVNAPRDVDEWFGSGLTQEKSLWKDIDLAKPGASPGAVLIIGLIKLIHVRNDILVHPEDTNIDPHLRAFTIEAAKLRAVSRMGGITYGRIGEGFETPRPVWNEVKEAYADHMKVEDKQETE